MILSPALVKSTEAFIRLFGFVFTYIPHIKSLKEYDKESLELSHQYSISSCLLQKEKSLQRSAWIKHSNTTPELVFEPNYPVRRCEIKT